MHFFGSSKYNSSIIDPIIVDGIKKMVDEHNPLAKSFKIARDLLNSKPIPNLKLKLIQKRGANPLTYNLPSCSKIAMLIVCDIEYLNKDRDIIIQTQSRNLQHIHELHLPYLPLQHPLIFVTSQDGYI